MPSLYGNRKTYNILLVGVCGAGKSSLINSLRTVCSKNADEISAAATVQAAGSYSTTMKVFLYAYVTEVWNINIPYFIKSLRWIAFYLCMHACLCVCVCVCVCEGVCVRVRVCVCVCV